MLPLKGQVHGFQPLHRASRDGNVRVVNAHIEAGADVEARSGVYHVRGVKLRGLTALHVAAVHGKMECVRAFLKGGIDIDVKDKNGMTSLCAVCWAASKDGVQKHAGEVDTLIGLGANTMIPDDDGELPVDLIGHHDDPRGILKDVLQKGRGRWRVWRRRGWIVMLRSRATTEAAAGDTGGGSCNGPMSERAQLRMIMKSRRIGGAETEGDFKAVVTSLVSLGLHEPGLFRRVVSFV